MEQTDGGATGGTSLMGGDITPPVDDMTVPPTDDTPPAAPDLPEWLKGLELESDLVSDPSLKAIKDMPTLVKSYVHAQRKMGADKIVLPNKNSTNEEWLQLYHKLGLPTDFGEYKVDVEESTIDEEFTEGFRKLAYEQKLLPQQANELYGYINNQIKSVNERLLNSQQSELENGINALKEEWGEAFEQNVFKAKATVKEFGGPEFQKYLNESGLGNDPRLIKVFSHIGAKFFQEDSFAGDSKPAYAMSPSDAQAKINQITGDFGGAYYNSMHPDHNRIVDEVAKLYEMVSRPKK